MSQLRNILMTRGRTSHTVLSHCFFNESPVQTDIIPVSTWNRVEFSFSYNSSTHNVFCFGSRAYSGSADRLQVQASPLYSRLNTTVGSHDTVHNIVSDITTRIDWVCDGFTVSTTNEGTTTTESIPSADGIPNGAYPICVGGLQDGVNLVTPQMVGYFYQLKIWDSGVLSHEIIPVKDNSNVICLYDTIGGNYYYPIAGTLLLEEEPNA